MYTPIWIKGHLFHWAPPTYRHLRWTPPLYWWPGPWQRWHLHRKCTAFDSGHLPVLGTPPVIRSMEHLTLVWKICNTPSCWLASQQICITSSKWKPKNTVGSTLSATIMSSRQCTFACMQAIIFSPILSQAFAKSGEPELTSIAVVIISTISPSLILAIIVLIIVIAIVRYRW